MVKALHFSLCLARCSPHQHRRSSARQIYVAPSCAAAGSVQAPRQCCKASVDLHPCARGVLPCSPTKLHCDCAACAGTKLHRRRGGAAALLSCCENLLAVHGQANNQDDRLLRNTVVQHLTRRRLVISTATLEIFALPALQDREDSMKESRCPHAPIRSEPASAGSHQ